MNIEEIKEKIKETEGLTLEIVEEDSIYSFDYIANRFLTFKSNYLDTKFTFNSLKVDKEKFYDMLEKLNKDLFMIVDEVFFINEREDLDKLLNRLDSQNFYVDSAVGGYLYMDNIIVINVYLLRQLSIHYDHFIGGIWTTLIHELKHSMLSNPLIQGRKVLDCEDEEEVVEEYCIRIYEEIVEKDKNKYCFKYD